MNLFNELGIKELDLGDVDIKVNDLHPIITGLMNLAGPYRRNLISASYHGHAAIHTLSEDYMEILAKGDNSKFSVRLPVKKGGVRYRSSGSSR